MTDVELAEIEAKAKEVLSQAPDFPITISGAEDAFIDFAKSAFLVPHRDAIALVAEVRKLRGLLKRCEWVPVGNGWEACPLCTRAVISDLRLSDSRADRDIGHAPDCELAAALR